MCLLFCVPPHEKYVECLGSYNLVFIAVLVINIHDFSLFPYETLELYHLVLSHSEPKQYCALMNFYHSFHILVFWIVIFCIVIGGCQRFWSQTLCDVKRTFPPKTVCYSLLSIAYHMSRPFRQPLFNHSAVGITHHNASHYAVFSSLLLLPPNSVEIFYSALCF